MLLVLYDRLAFLYVKPNSGETGWDTFYLDYHVEAPLDMILHPQALRCYQRIFHFLWQVKRAEYTLKLTWQGQMALPLFLYRTSSKFDLIGCNVTSIVYFYHDGRY
jgi:hypothetical protein